MSPKIRGLININVRGSVVKVTIYAGNNTEVVPC